MATTSAWLRPIQVLIVLAFIVDLSLGAIWALDLRPNPEVGRSRGIQTLTEWHDSATDRLLHLRNLGDYWFNPIAWLSTAIGGYEAHTLYRLRRDHPEATYILTLGRLAGFAALVVAFRLAGHLGHPRRHG
jgi:hypothetical protein